MRLLLVLPLGLLAVALAATTAGAQGPVSAATSTPDPQPELALQLELELGPGAQLCPGEEVLHRALAQRLGYNPFRPEAPSVPAGRLSVSARSWAS